MTEQRSPLSLTRTAASLFSTLLFSVPLILTLACGGGTIAPLPSEAPTIATQPASQTIPFGQSATFTVLAAGKTPLTYQWSKNGEIIGGATEASYTTSPVILADEGATFTVQVSNPVGSAASNPATLSVGPRSPKAGDLRFQQVGSVTTAHGYGQVGVSVHYGFTGRMAMFFTNYYGSPFSTGAGCMSAGSPYNCMYALEVFPLPIDVPDMKTSYSADMLEYFDQQLQQIVAADAVITSLNLEPSNDNFAVSWVESPQSKGFSFNQVTMPLAGLQDYAAQQAQQGRVITAVSFNGTATVYVLSYGWNDDPRRRL